jgi:hypothetical protein
MTMQNDLVDFVVHHFGLAEMIECRITPQYTQLDDVHDGREPIRALKDGLERNGAPPQGYAPEVVTTKQGHDLANLRVG